MPNVTLPEDIMTPLSHSFKVRHLILAVALTTGLGFVNYANAQTAQAHRSFLVDLDSRTAVDLGNLIGRGGVGATGINEAGQVVGYIQTAEYPSLSYAFITGPDGKGMRDLGTLGGAMSYAYGINEVGQVVGWSSTATADGNSHAFITGPDGEGMTDLNSLVNLPDGVILTQAVGINNNGQVIAMGMIPIPEPETYALMLAGLALVGAVIRRKEIV
jgi:probable HAF family extracellular repeat protein